MTTTRTYTFATIWTIGIMTVVWPAALHAQTLSEETEAHVRQATVQVIMGDKKAGSDRIGHKVGAFGSGCFINSTGLVITNNHVIDPTHGTGDPIAAFLLRDELNLLQYRITVSGGTPEEHTYKADLIYQCEAADLALLQARDDDDGLLETPAFLKIVPSGTLEIGDRVALFGFPGGNMMSNARGRSAPVNRTQGNIIAIPQRPSGRIKSIVTDVQAAGGNSGGPLVDEHGQAIGLVATIGADTRASTKVNARAVPGDLILDLLRVAKHLNKLSDRVDLTPFEEVRLLSANDSEPVPLGQRLDINDDDLRNIAQLLESGEVDDVETLFEAAVDRKSPDSLKEQAKALKAELHLRTGDYDNALSLFKRLSRADMDEIKDYAIGRRYLLKLHSDGVYEDQPLSDPEVWDRAGRNASATIVEQAREQISAYRQALPDDHSGWKKLTRSIKKLEDDLMAADSLAPGTGELDLFLAWRFRQDANLHEIMRLLDTTKELEREIQDFNARPRPANKRALRARNKKLEALNRRIARFRKQLTTVSREWEDLRELMSTQGWAGFRIDDPAAVAVLD